MIKEETERNTYEGICESLLGGDVINLRLHLNSCETLRKQVIIGAGKNSHLRTVMVATGANNGRGSLLHLIFLCVKYKMSLKFKIFIWLNKFVAKHFDGAEYTPILYDEQTFLDQTMVDQKPLDDSESKKLTRGILESLVQDKTLVNVFFLDREEGIERTNDDVALRNTRKKKETRSEKYEE